MTPTLLGQCQIAFFQAKCKFIIKAILKRRIYWCYHTWGLLLTKDISVSQWKCIVSYTTKTKSTIDQWCLVKGKCFGFSLRQMCSGSFWTGFKSQHQLGANVMWVRSPLGMWSLHGLQNCYQSWIWVSLPDMKQSQSTEIRLWFRKVQYLLQGDRQGEWAASAQKTQTHWWLFKKSILYIVMCIY